MVFIVSKGGAYERYLHERKADFSAADLNGPAYGRLDAGQCTVQPVSYTHLDVYKRQVFLLDENDVLVTVPGQAGEICVSGTALALGYYADPVRTAQAFTQNPLNTNWYERIYRTGDLARYDESGSLYYIGRRDFQIKHMGHRVELGEIEAAAMRCDAVTRACCTFDAERQRLHLFYTGSCEKAALLAALKESLPPFMQPNTAVQLDEMPLNKNGKIDRTALAALTKKGAHK